MTGTTTDGKIAEMTAGVGIWRCARCATGFFPQPLLCPSCHHDVFTPDRIYEAVVEEAAVIHHMLGQSDWQPRRIAAVRTGDGLCFTVGLTDEAGPGTTIALCQDGTAPFGRAKD